MKTIAPAVAVSVVIIAGSALAALQAVPICVGETRAVTLIKDNVGRPKDALAVQLSLSGPEADAAYRFGPVTFEEAVDAQGGNLVPEAESYEPILRAFENETFRTAALERKERPDNPWASLNLAPAKRSATKISRLRGSFNVYSRGTIKSVEAMGLVTAKTVTLDVPKVAGLTVTLAVHPHRDPLSIEVQLAGDVTALEALEVFDSSDKAIAAYFFLTRSKGRAPTGSLKLSQLLTDKMRIVAKIATDRTVTPVQFDLKDVPLP